MENAQAYLEKTESAVRFLFKAVDEYLELLKAGSKPVFLSGLNSGPGQDAHYATWRKENDFALDDAKAALHAFRAETFALDTVCGAILQIAEKGLEIYSKNTQLPQAGIGNISPALAKFCVGRIVRSTNLGLIVYAARNQHTHFNDVKLGKVSASVFANLALAHGYTSPEPDPAFDLKNPNLFSYASNVTALIGWRNFKIYQEDMCSMLGL